MSSLFNASGAGTPFTTNVTLNSSLGGPYTEVLYGSPVDKYTLFKFVLLETNYNVASAQSFDIHILKTGGLSLVTYAIVGGTYTIASIPAGPGNFTLLTYNLGITFGRELDNNFILLYPGESIRLVYSNAGNGFNKAITFSAITFGA